MGIRKAFTLAEVLVTLGIIGVVSAMTIPSLTQSWQKKAYVTQLHKVYNVFQQAFAQMLNDNHAMYLEEAGLISSDDVEKKFLHDHFKVIKDCGRSTVGCFASKYRGLDGGTTSPNNVGHNVVIADGTAVSFHIDGMDADTVEEDDYMGYMYVDTNGLKGPNVAGRDYFRMYFFADGAVDDYRVNIACRTGKDDCDGHNTPQGRREYNYSKYCRNAGDTDGCFGKLLNDNWEMNY